MLNCSLKNLKKWRRMSTWMKKVSQSRKEVYSLIQYPWLTKRASNWH